MSKTEEEVIENPTKPKPNQALLKLGMFIGILLLFFVLVKYTSLSEYANKETLINYREKLRSLSENWWFPLAFILAYVFGVVISFSGLILTTAGGIIFGTAKGTLLNVIAANIGAEFLAFLIGRYLGRDIVEKLAKRKT